MNKKNEISCDLIVIGAGFAGMVAAARAAALGMKTLQFGSSSPLFLTSGLMDFLGVYPLESKTALATPGEGLKKLEIQMPDHPYSKAGLNQIIESFDFVRQFLTSANLIYHSGEKENTSVLTAAGTFKPSFMVPETFLKGSTIRQKNRKPLFVDFQGFREFSAKQTAAVIHEKYPNSENPGSKPLALTIELPGVRGNISPNRLAAMFEDIQFIEFIADKIKPFTNDIDIIGLPAVCGIKDSLETIKLLEQMTETDCFEIPGLPPSIPGLRLKNAFEKKLAQNDVKAFNNSKIKFTGMQEDHMTFDALTENESTRILAKGAVLATGRFPGGGLHARRDSIHETVFGLPVRQPEKRSEWHNLDFFHPKGHSINTAGLETDERFRPLDQNKTPMFENLYAAGSILAHNDWVRLKSGSGVSCVTAITAVNDFHKKISGAANA
jgi:glycerol-3-phosphate dehydrogenase subunit B